VSNTELMAGLGRAFTPTLTGNAIVILSGLVHNSTADVGVTIQGRFGQSGTPPVAGAAASGTVFGRAQRTLQSGNTQFATFICHAKLSSLSLGLPYWFDVSIICSAAGAAQVQDVQFTILEA
jgi:hypothetical protein